MRTTQSTRIQFAMEDVKLAMGSGPANHDEVLDCLDALWVEVDAARRAMRRGRRLTHGWGRGGGATGATPVLRHGAVS